MKNATGVNLELFEGRRFILGREGHIYIDSTTASKQHAELRIMDGRIYLRDLDSTNGTFLLQGNSRVRFDKGFVEPEQAIVIGGQIHVVMDLLAIATDFAAVGEGETEIGLMEQAGGHSGIA
jgi:pSer/pThr/pTyr-binding forkhead associated (FHA) protein